MVHLLTDFQVIRPSFTSSQEATLDWIVAAHTQAEFLKQKKAWSETEKAEFAENLKKELYRVGCKPHVIHERGHFIADILHQDWDAMQVYRLQETLQGVGLGERQKQHLAITDALFEKIYATKHEAPKNLIHVSCTGYSSPSSAQKIIARKNWGETTQVTHAYHMGCYAACPAVRLGSSFQEGADVVHTELTSLHFNPLLHTNDQLVAQSLFADGAIYYKVTPEATRGPSLALCAIHEEIIPGSEEAMKWHIDDWGFQLFLAKEIPVLIAQHVQKYVLNLCKKAEISFEELVANGIFAIHPGGPKIIEYLQKLLRCQDKQLQHSRAVLQQYGNMSSATLPHVWKAIVEDESIQEGTKVLSLAFGPGLTIAGMILEKKQGGG